MMANDTIFRRGLRRARAAITTELRLPRAIVAAVLETGGSYAAARAHFGAIAKLDVPTGSAFVRWYSIRQHDGRRPSGVGHNQSKWHITLDGSTTLCGCTIDLYPETKPTRPAGPVCRRCLAAERNRSNARDEGNPITTAQGD